MNGGKRALNLRMHTATIRRLKTRALELETTASDLVAHLVETQLGSVKPDMFSGYVSTYHLPVTEDSDS